MGRFGELSQVEAWQGVALMLLATGCFASLGAIIRLNSPAIHPFQIVFLRNLFGFLTLSPLLLQAGIQSLRTTKIGLYLSRGVISTVGMLLSFWAASILPLAEATALSFTQLLFASLIAVLVLQERMRPYRWLALGLGFAGALVMLRPGFQEGSLGIGLTLIASALFAWVTIVIKMLSRTESSITITAYMGLLQTPMSFLAAVWVWTWPSPEQWLWMVAMGLLGTIGQVALTQAYKLADVTTVMPLDFSRLIWASLIGFWVFAEIPDWWTCLGGALIFAGATSGVYGEARWRMLQTQARTSGV
ncbi:DMT family transporter [Synechococcus bigranulatus str. 'Rupite']|uniref:DMT family transporter n=2 Tax=Thermostichus vulcanus TaxID=32053 RepID=A0ABT0C9T8_THEVL|nr:DMT family transporter [Thermostichus vulcanus str. 'Rupite']